MVNRRAAMFVAVAALGFAVQVSAIVALNTLAGLPVAAATAVGVLLALAHNFAWHERWTWADRRMGGHVIVRLVKFAASIGVVSLTGTVVLTTVYVSLLRMPIFVGNLLAVWSTAVLNYLVLDRLIFRELES
jgi:putative flippase GtrA